MKTMLELVKVAEAAVTAKQSDAFEQVLAAAAEQAHVVAMLEAELKARRPGVRM